MQLLKKACAALGFALSMAMAALLSACGGGDALPQDGQWFKAESIIERDTWALPANGIGPVWQNLGEIVYTNTGAAPIKIQITAHAKRVLTVGQLGYGVNPVSFITYNIDGAEVQSIGRFTITWGINARQNAEWADDVSAQIDLAPGATIKVRLTCVVGAGSFGVGSVVITNGYLRVQT